MKYFVRGSFRCLVFAGIFTACVWARAEAVPEALQPSVEAAVARVHPALVQIHVVRTYYEEGRELKYEAMGSGAVITPEGHVITNHHVAGHSTRLMCTFPDKEEIEAELVGTDPLTDIAVLKLLPEPPREFAVAVFGDSDALYVGQSVLSMGCPMALSQSVTLGIVSNTQMVMSEWSGGITLDGEDVGALVRWIAHDAEIYGGNSGGPLVNLAGEVIGINEIRLGLSGAIPGNLAQSVAKALIEHGKVQRSWLGLDVQPLLKRGETDRGVLISGVIAGSPAETAGFQSGDVLVRVADTPVTVRFAEEMPALNRSMIELPIGAPVEMGVLRGGQEVALSVTPVEREEVKPKEHEMKPWGLTVRNLSLMDAKELKRDNTDGILVTSVRPGGPANEAKPTIEAQDILVSMNGQPVRNVDGLRAQTEALNIEKGATAPVLTGFDRKTGEFVTVVRVGIRDLPDPALQVRKAWLAADTQVLTRDIAEALGKPDLTGFRVTQVYENNAAEKAGLRVGDVIVAVDGVALTATAPEHYEELPTLVRQYPIGATAELSIVRGGETLTLPVELVAAPQSDREMKRYQDENFDLAVRNISFFDKAREKWTDAVQGVLVDEVKQGSWAALGRLSAGDLVLDVQGEAVADVDAFERILQGIAETKPKAVVFRVLRGIHTQFIELEPKWDENGD